MKCAVWGCHKESRALEHCKGHYAQIVKHGKVIKEKLRGRAAAEPKDRPTCSEAFCAEPHHAKTLCSRCYHKDWRSKNRKKLKRKDAL